MPVPKRRAPAPAKTAPAETTAARAAKPAVAKPAAPETEAKAAFARPAGGAGAHTSAELVMGSPVILFESSRAWADWLAANHATSPAVWLRLAKKDGGLTSVTYAEALDEALCHGWIDGQKRTYDDASWLQKFTLRGAKSVWSKINVAKTRGLIESGRMKPAGLRAIEAAQRDGRWEAAYESQSKITVPPDFQSALDGRPKAKAFFATLNSANRYAMLFRIHNSKKAETRARWIARFLDMLEAGEKLHP